MHLVRDPLPRPSHRADDPMILTRPLVRVLVCGNEDRCDDGAAIWAVGHLVPGTGVDDLPGIDLVHCGQLDVEDLIDDGHGAPVLIVDTAVGVAPGRSRDARLRRAARSSAPDSAAQQPRAADRPGHRHRAGCFRHARRRTVRGHRRERSRLRQTSCHGQCVKSMGEFVVAIEKAALMRLGVGDAIRCALRFARRSSAARATRSSSTARAGCAARRRCWCPTSTSAIGFYVAAGTVIERLDPGAGTNRSTSCCMTHKESLQ